MTTKLTKEMVESIHRKPPKGILHRLVAYGGAAVLVAAFALGDIGLSEASAQPGHLGANQVVKTKGPIRSVFDGTVSSVGSSAFSVKTTQGKSVNLVTSNSTKYTKSATTTVAAIGVGTFIDVTGTRGSTGSLSATRITIVPAPKTTPKWPTKQTKADKANRAYGEVTTVSKGTLVIESFQGPQTITVVTPSPVIRVSDAAFATLVVTDQVQVQAEKNGSTNWSATYVNIGVPITSVGVRPNKTGRGRSSRSARHAFESGVVGPVGVTTFTITTSVGKASQVRVVKTKTAFFETFPGTRSSATVGSDVIAVGSLGAKTTFVATALSIVPSLPAKVPNSHAMVGWPKRVQGVVSANGTTLLQVSTGKATISVGISAETKITVTIKTAFASVVTGSPVQVEGVRTFDPQTASSSFSANCVNLGVVPSVFLATPHARAKEQKKATAKSKTLSQSKTSKPLAQVVGHFRTLVPKTSGQGSASDPPAQKHPKRANPSSSHGHNMRQGKGQERGFA